MAPSAPFSAAESVAPRPRTPPTPRALPTQPTQPAARLAAIVHGHNPSAEVRETASVYRVRTPSRIGVSGRTS